MRRRITLAAAAVLAGAATGLAGGADRPDPAELLPGGSATARNAQGATAFSLPSTSLPFERLLDFKVGDAVFRRLWVAAPASTRNADGLGPIYNARGCQSCQMRDGRGRPPEAGEPASSLLLRLSVPPRAGCRRTRSRPTGCTYKLSASPAIRPRRAWK
ncbi:di-heme oxidoredictase family protein [Falsiroseomonas sp. HC035]|uniref:di-heme oxidoredictase family protein n=1 Tax=Falsiroseomonas sp. HC035 TaxID=3390999 RepID=UPI003D30F1F0